MDSRLDYADLGRGTSSLDPEELAAFLVDEGTTPPLDSDLLRAADEGFLSLVTLLLANGADVKSRDARGDTPLHLACRGNHVDVAKLLLKEGADMESKNSLGDTPLNFSALDVAQLLVKCGANVNTANNDQWTPIHGAANSSPRGLSLLKLLVSQGAEIECHTLHLWTPLNLALDRSNEEMSVYLLQKGAKVSNPGPHGNTPLHYAAMKDLQEAAKLLLEKGADLEAINDTGNRPLHLACSTRARRITQLLLDNGALIEAPNSSQERALHIALRSHDLISAKILLRHGADLTALDKRQFSPLHVAANGNQMGTVACLLEEGVNVESANSDPNSHDIPRHAKRQCRDAVQLLLEWGAKDNQLDEEGRTALHVAIDHCNVEAAAILIEKGANVKGPLLSNIEIEKYIQSRNVLHYAAESQPIVLQFLLDNGGFDVESEEENGWTALVLAVEANNEDCVKLLLDYGANPDATARCDCEIHHRVPTSHKAAKMGYAGVLQMLLDAGADPNSLDSSMNTPLTWASECADSRCLEILLRTGRVNVNHENWERGTPLFYAATFGWIENVKLLLRVDTNRKVQSKSGKTAKEGAREKGYQEIVKLFEDDEAGNHQADQVLLATNITYSYHASCLDSLGEILTGRYNRTGGMEDLEEAIRRGEQAIAAAYKNDPQLALYRNNLGIRLFKWFELTERMECLQQAINQTGKAVRVTQKDNPNLIRYLNDLAQMLQVRSEWTGTLQDLRTAIQGIRRAVSAMPKGHKDLARSLNNLGYLCQRLSWRTLSPKYQREAIRRMYQAINETPKDHPDSAGVLNNLGTVLAKQFERTRNLKDLNVAVRRVKQAVAVTPENDPYLGFYLHNLATLLTRRSEVKGRMGNLEDAISRAARVISATPEKYHDPSSYPDSRVRISYLQSRLNRTRRRKNRDEVERRGELAFAATTEDHGELSAYLNRPSELLYRWGRMGSLRDLKAAILQLKQATALIFHHSSGIALCLNKLRNVLIKQFEILSREKSEIFGRDDLKSEFKSAPIQNPEGSEENDSRKEYNLNSMNHVPIGESVENFEYRLQREFQKLGRLGELLEVFQSAEQEMAAPMPERDRNFAAYLKRLGDLLSAKERAVREGEDEEIRSIKELLTTTSENHEDMGSTLDRLGILLGRRFFRTGKMEDLEDAIGCSEQAAAIPIEDHKCLETRLEGLSILLECRFQRTGQIEHLEEINCRNEQMTLDKTLGPSKSRDSSRFMVVPYEHTGRFESPSWDDCSVCDKLRIRTRRKHFFGFANLMGTALPPGHPVCSVCAMLRRGLALFDGYVRKWFRDDLSDAGQDSFFYSRRQGSPVWLHTSWIDLEFFAIEGNTEMSQRLIVAGSMSGDTSSDACLSRVRAWIEDCESNHPSCIEGSCVGKSLPSRVLDLHADDLNGDIKLVEMKGKAEKYLCLSYCWGGDGICTTTKSNISQRMTGISLGSLPQTFRDAINLTRRLKVRYLWIDALCIIQDDKNDWEIESGQMASIFANSFLTIAATKSRNANEGLYSKPSPGYGTTRQFVHEDSNGEATTIHVREKLDHRQLFYSEAESFFYSGGLSTGIAYPLIQRSWGFQERLLTSRTLHFLPGEVAWECNTVMHCECGGLDGHDTNVNPKITYEANTPTEEKEESIRLWHHILDGYLGLSLTFDSDRLPALSGLAKKVQQKLGCEYLAGLWKYNLWNELLWRNHDDGQLIHGRRAYKPQEYRGPSWSWVGIENLVDRIYPTNYARMDEIDFRFLRLLDVQCQPRGVDSTGEVASGYLKVAAYVRPVTMGRYKKKVTTLSERENFTITFGKWTSDFLADCPGSVNEDDRIEEGEELFCLRMGFKGVDASRRAVRRRRSTWDASIDSHPVTISNGEESSVEEVMRSRIASEAPSGSRTGPGRPDRSRPTSASERSVSDVRSGVQFIHRAVEASDDRNGSSSSFHASWYERRPRRMPPFREGGSDPADTNVDHFERSASPHSDQSSRRHFPRRSRDTRSYYRRRRDVVRSESEDSSHPRSRRPSRDSMRPESPDLSRPSARRRSRGVTRLDSEDLSRSPRRHRSRSSGGSESEVVIHRLSRPRRYRNRSLGSLESEVVIHRSSRPRRYRSRSSGGSESDVVIRRLSRPRPRIRHDSDSDSRDVYSLDLDEMGRPRHLRGSEHCSYDSEGLESEEWSSLRSETPTNSYLDSPPHLPSVSDSDVESGPDGPPNPLELDNHEQRLEEVMMYERVSVHDQHRDAIQGLEPADYLVLRRIDPSQYQSRAGALYGKILEGMEACNAVEGTGGVGKEGEQDEPHRPVASFSMFERVGLVPEWGIKIKQDLEWFADVEESIVVIV